MPKRHDNTIYKQFLKNKKTIKVILSNITKIRPIIYIKDPKEAPGINYTYIKNTKAEETTIVDIATTSYPVKNNIISIINLNTS